jgi:hypothetical protein
MSWPVAWRAVFAASFSSEFVVLSPPFLSILPRRIEHSLSKGRRSNGSTISCAVSTPAVSHMTYSCSCLGVIRGAKYWQKLRHFPNMSSKSVSSLWSGSQYALSQLGWLQSWHAGFSQLGQEPQQFSRTTSEVIVANRLLGIDLSTERPPISLRQTLNVFSVQNIEATSSPIDWFWRVEKWMGRIYAVAVVPRPPIVRPNFTAAETVKLDCRVRRPFNEMRKADGSPWNPLLARHILEILNSELAIARMIRTQRGVSFSNLGSDALYREVVGA